jgi:hypothetical protein
VPSLTPYSRRFFRSPDVVRYLHHTAKSAGRRYRWLSRNARGAWVSRVQARAALNPATDSGKRLENKKQQI